MGEGTRDPRVKDRLTGNHCLDEPVFPAAFGRRATKRISVMSAASVAGTSAFESALSCSWLVLIPRASLLYTCLAVSW